MREKREGGKERERIEYTAVEAEEGDGSYKGGKGVEGCIGVGAGLTGGGHIFN